MIAPVLVPAIGSNTSDEVVALPLGAKQLLDPRQDLEREDSADATAVE
jgi:hypothetical protein